VRCVVFVEEKDEEEREEKSQTVEREESQPSV
jgi:hypothetical protein